MLNELDPYYKEPMDIVLSLCVFDSKTLLEKTVIAVFGEEANIVIYISLKERLKRTNRMQPVVFSLLGVCHS